MPTRSINFKLIVLQKNNEPRLIGKPFGLLIGRSTERLNTTRGCCLRCVGVLTPAVHFLMMDGVFNKECRCAILCIRGVGKALSLDSLVYTSNGPVSIQDVRLGDEVFGEDGKATEIIYKSPIFHKKMYRITLGDGRTLKVSEDHINTVIHRRQKRVNGKRINYLDRRDIPTNDLLQIPLTASRKSTKKNPKGQENRLWFPLTNPIEYSNKSLPIDPYTLGLLLGDGSMSRETGYSRLHCHCADQQHYLNNIPYAIGKTFKDKRNPTTLTFGILDLGKRLKALGCNVHGNYKKIPEQYLFGSISQRIAILNGLMDTDGSITSNGGISFSSNSIYLVKGVQELIWSIGGMAHYTNKKKSYQLNIQINIPIFSLPRKLNRQHFKCLYRNPVVSIEEISTEPSQCIAVGNTTHTFLTNGYTVTHNTTLFGNSGMGS